MSNTNDQLPDVQENTSQILNDVQSLQTIEQELFNSLEENTGLTIDQQKAVVEKINNISKMRINLYQTLNGVNSFFSNTLANSKGTLTEQTAAIDIVEKELNSSKKRLAVLEEEKNNKIRLVEINNYYGQKYAEHSDLMKIIIYMLIPILIIAILFNKGILPSKIYYILIGIIAVIGGIFIWKTLFSIMFRDPMNYQEYDWFFKPPESVNPTDISDPWVSKNVVSNFGSCVGDACCSDGLVYDSSLNQCVTSNASDSNTTSTSSSFPTENTNKNTTKPTIETFMNNVFTKSLNNFKKPDVILGGENIMPTNSPSFINFKNF